MTDTQTTLRPRFLVTGATGFIGSHAVDALLSRGYDVVCVVRNVSALRNLAPAGAQVIALDNMESAMEAGPPVDYVIHIAGATRALNYESYRMANVDLTRRLLELFDRPGRRENLKRFVFISSQAAGGPSPNSGSGVVETDPVRPVSLYGRSKLEAERTVVEFSERVPVTIIRPPTVFGPRDVDVLGVFKCARFRIAPCIAGPERLVSIIYVEDLVEGILEASFSRKSEGETYFLANSEPVIWRAFCLEVARVLGYHAIAVPVPLFVMKIVAKTGDVIAGFTGRAPLLRTEKLEEMRQMAWVCSTEKACRDLRWKPRTPLSEAIEKTARWYKEHGWL